MTGYKHTGIFVSKEELDQVQTAQRTSGMFLSGGQPMGDPCAVVTRLAEKYRQPKRAALEIETGEFVLEEEL